MTVLALISLLAWIYLLCLHGRFWLTGPMLTGRVLASARPKAAPTVAVVMPARDEAEVIGRSLSSVLAQDYPGDFSVVLVDDGSSDGTGAIARESPGAGRLTVIAGTARPPGWAGKLWAVSQGVAATDAEYLLLTDADIEHDPTHLAALMAQAEHSGADLVSEMVMLNCSSLAERALVPGFVYFFAMLYPFAWVRDPRCRVAAAAGGTVLIRRAALERIGGIGAIRGALIDDVALAAAVKPGGRIWLGHSRLARSIRRYPHFADIWRMIARSAYVQLRFSPWLLGGSLLAMALLFLLPPVATVAGSVFGAAAWVLMSASFVVTLRRYGGSLAWAPLLPAVAAFYMAATVGSALDHHCGRGVMWKRRAYTGGEA